MKENRRVRYTKNTLRETLLSLLEEKPINKITVSELCQMADINRSTFYLYYENVQDLLEQIQEELFLQIDAAVAAASVSFPQMDLIYQVFAVIEANRDLCRVLFGPHGDKAFLRRVSASQRQRILSEWGKFFTNTDPKQMEYLMHYVTDGCMGVIEHWIETGFQDSCEQIAGFVTLMVTRGLRTFS